MDWIVFPSQGWLSLMLQHIFNNWVLHFCQFSGEALVEFIKALNQSNTPFIEWSDHFVSPCYSWSDVTCRSGNVVSV